MIRHLTKESLGRLPQGRDRPRRGRPWGSWAQAVGPAGQGHLLPGARLAVLLAASLPFYLHLLAKYNFADGQFNRSLFPVFSFFSAVLSFFLCFSEFLYNPGTEGG